MKETASPQKSKKVLREEIFENDQLRLKVVPALGGKITELLNKQTGTQFIRTGNLPLSEMKYPEYGDSFLPPYAFGFDECFPSVAPDKIRDNGSKKNIPDHGELWTHPWKLTRKPEKLVLTIRGKSLNYRLRKEITLHKNQVEFAYRLKNTGDESFDYLWSAHPLLGVQAGDEILLPAGTQTVRVHYTTDKRINDGAIASWPALINNEDNYNGVKEKSADFAAKLFVEHPETGKAALYRKQLDESLQVEFDTECIPHLGLWLCYGGWPEDERYSADYTIALEPTTAATDVLSEARARKQSIYLAPGEVKTWKITFSAINGKPIDF